MVKFSNLLTFFVLHLGTVISVQQRLVKDATEIHTFMHLSLRDRISNDKLSINLTLQHITQHGSELRVTGCVGDICSADGVLRIAHGAHMNAHTSWF